MENVNGGKIELDLRGKDKGVVCMEKEECIQTIRSIQMKNNFTKNIKKLDLKQRFTLDIWNDNNKNLPKYTLIIVDSENKAILNKV